MMKAQAGRMRAYCAAADLLEAASSLEETFQVSRTLTLHQITNSDLGASISTTELKRLERWAL